MFTLYGQAPLWIANGLITISAALVWWFAFRLDSSDPEERAFNRGDTQTGRSDVRMIPNRLAHRKAGLRQGLTGETPSSSSQVFAIKQMTWLPVWVLLLLFVWKTKWECKALNNGDFSRKNWQSATYRNRGDNGIERSKLSQTVPTYSLPNSDCVQEPPFFMMLVSIRIWFSF